MKSALLIILLALLSIVALAAAVAPNLMLTPPRDHAPDDITLAFWWRRLAPVMTSVLAIAAAILAIKVWRMRGGGRVTSALRAGLLVILLVPAAGSIALSRFSVVEMSFNPLDEVRFAAPDEAGATDEESVMGIVVGGEARAYPVRIVAYHHIVHDTVGGEPVVATY